MSTNGQHSVRERIGAFLACVGVFCAAGASATTPKQGVASATLRSCETSVVAAAPARVFSPAATYTVNTTDDIDDLVCDVSHCSLREAINASNATPAVSDTIAFNIGGGGQQTIALLNPLPGITDSVLIDGSSQPGFTSAPLVQLDGAALLLGDGLDISGGNTTVRSLIISRFPEHGIDLNTLGANTIQGCYIGTDPSGLVAQGNLGDGVSIDSSSFNSIDGMTAPYGINVISANSNGVSVSNTVSPNFINRNFIGTNVLGNSPLGNLSAGVSVASANTIIGGSAPGAGNLIGANGFGIFMSVSATGTQVRGNLIGVDVGGDAAMPNLNDGIFIDGASGNTVGGLLPGDMNIISGNLGNGIQLIAASNNGIKGNRIGTNATGVSPLGNGQSGIAIDSSSNNFIGGFREGNLISGNGSEGIKIVLGSSSNEVRGNFIGTDASGFFDIGNALSGVFVDGSSGNTIGGAAPGARNVISGNGDGLTLGDGADSNFVKGNLIGTRSNGRDALPNDFNGIVIAGGSNNFIGGQFSGEGNVICGNPVAGINLQDGASFFSTGNLIHGNRIGLMRGGFLPLPNGEGVHIEGSSDGNSIGGLDPGEGNIIARNLFDGIVAFTAVGTPVSNFFGRNAIFGNGELGIDLGNDGVTVCDPGDPDSGPNELQNFPLLTSVVSTGGLTTVQGAFNSTPLSGPFRVEFFATPICNAAGNGEGLAFLDSVDLFTDAGGDATFNVTISRSVAGGHSVTATATNSTFNTSEFSACLPAVGPPPGSFGRPRNHAAGIGPSAVTTADVDADGALDIITADASGNGMSLLRGNGDGTFQPVAAIPTGLGPEAVATGYFNGDNSLDLVTANDVSGDVSILIGIGGGSFLPAASFGVGSSPGAVAVEDLDDDLAIDLVVANKSSDSVSVLRGNGDGTFLVATEFPTGFRPSAVVIGDFNADTVPDLAVANRNSGTVSLLRGNGDGTFLVATDSTVGLEPMALAAKDLDGDGVLDLVVTNKGDDDTSVLRGNGDGTFLVATDYPTGSEPSSVIVDDFDANGTLDLVVANKAGNSMSLLRGNGDGTFLVATELPVGSSPAGIAVGDFDANGLPDVAAANFLGNNAGVRLNAAAIFGDFDENGAIDATDAVLLANYLVGNLPAGAPPFTAPLEIADQNQDGLVNAVDAVVLANFLVGNICCLPAP